MKILAIDDEQDLLELLKVFLTSKDHENVGYYSSWNGSCVCSSFTTLKYTLCKSSMNNKDAKRPCYCSNNELNHEKLAFQRSYNLQFVSKSMN